MLNRFSVPQLHECTINLSKVLHKTIKLDLVDESKFTNTTYTGTPGTPIAGTTKQNLLFKHYTCYYNILLLKDGLCSLALFPFDTNIKKIMDLKPYQYFLQLHGLKPNPASDKCTPEYKRGRYNEFYTLLLDMAKNVDSQAGIRALSSIGLFNLGDHHGIAVKNGKETTDVDNWEVVGDGHQGNDHNCYNGRYGGSNALLAGQRFTETPDLLTNPNDPVLYNNMPIVVIVTEKGYDKILSNIQEVKSRGGNIIVISSVNNNDLRKLTNHFIYIKGLKDIHNSLTPIITSIPLQLLAYHIAVLRGCNVDQPRNLAKSVTVE